MNTIMQFIIQCIFLYLQLVPILCSLCSNNSKCNCIDLKKKVSVECTYLKNISHIQDIFNKDLESKVVSQLKLTRCSVKTIPASAFLNATIQNIDADCPFKNMDDSAFLMVKSLKILHLTSTEFERIPKAIFGLADLQSLHIEGGKLKEVELESMTKLEKLILKKNKIKYFSINASGEVCNLKSIDLSGNGLVRIEPATFDPCKSLKEVILQDNNINSTIGLFSNPELQEINLRSNKLESIEEPFQTEIPLTKLDLGMNPLSEISDKAFGSNIKHLKTLLLDSCKLRELPWTLFHSLRELVTVNLSKNKLEVIPAALFHDLSYLEELDLRGNKIHTTSGAFKRNDGLLRIFLSKNFLKECGDMFQNMQSLQKIDLANNRIEYIRESDFSTTPSLTQLVLNKNIIYRVDSDAFIHLRQLQNLNLEGNLLGVLNGSVRDLPELQSLSLHHNRLAEIGEYEMRDLPNLRRLNLGNNTLVSVQGAFRKLKSLTSLTLSPNKLETLTRSTFPEELKLEELFLSGNKWACDCRISWLHHWTTSNLKILKNSLECASPPEFRKRKLSQLTSGDLTVWPKNCEKRCECTCVAEDVGYYVRVNCSNRGLSKAPSALPEGVGEILLQHNSLTSPVQLNISKTQLKVLNLEGNFIEDIDFHFPETLETLMLAGNNLTRFNSYFPNPQLLAQKSITTWTLSNNPWICDCDAVPYWKWLKSQNGTVLDINSTRCSLDSGREETRGRVVIDLTELEICPPKHIILYASLAAGLVVFASFAIGSHFAYSRYHYHMKVWLYSRGFRWLKKSEGDDKDKIYDAYLAVCDKNLPLARRCILPELERNFYTVYVPQRNLVGGEFKLNQEIENVKKSRRMIVLLSRDYIKDQFCMAVFKMAYHNCLEERMFRIIPVILEDLPPLSEEDESLKITIESSKCPRFGGRLFWEMIRFAMPDISSDAEDEDAQEEDEPLLADC